MARSEREFWALVRGMGRRKGLLQRFTLIAGLALAACAPPPATATPPPAAAAPTVQAAQPVAHKAGTQHTVQPKRLETVVEIDMVEMSFSTPGGQAGAPIRVPAGKTVGLHIHNEGKVVHELMIGRKPVQMVEKTVGGQKVTVPHGYAKALFSDQEADVFAYYGNEKVEVGGAKFEELEMDPGLKDVWVRVNFPADARGEWEIGCFVAGHYEAGMRVDLIVE